MWSLKIPEDSSWAVRKFLQLRDSLRESFKIIIGDGREVSQFYDWWFRDIRLIGIEGMNAQLNAQGSHIKVSEWWHEDGWRLPTSFKMRWPQIARDLERVQLSVRENRSVWLHTNSVVILFLLPMNYST